jgi:hypothetical protein
VHFLPEMRRVKCPDGTDRYVLRDIDRVFPLFAPDWARQAKAAAAALNGLTASVEASVKTHVQGLFFQLDEANRSLHLKLRMAYITFATNPCSLDAKWLDNRTRELMDEESAFRRLMIEIQRLQALAASGVSGDVLSAEIKKALRVSQPIERQQIADAFKNVPKAIDEWQEGLG